MIPFPNVATGDFANNLQQQFNITDSVSYIVGAHQMKRGFDYRRLNPKPGLVPYMAQYLFLSLANDTDGLSATECP